MHPRVESLPSPDPDYRRFVKAVHRARPDRVPLIELAIHPLVVNALLDEPAVETHDAHAGLREATRRNVRLHHRLGYDVVKCSATIPWRVRRLTARDEAALGTGARQWADAHDGPISGREDVERFSWPRESDVDFGMFDVATAALPDGMALLAFCGGVLEFAMDLVGMERFMIATRRDPELVAAVIERVGQTVHNVFEVCCQMESVCALWLGDDLGYKAGLQLSPTWLSAHVLPWYRRFAELAHSRERPFLLHSCGHIEAIVSALVEDVGIDAKHSFEDAIEPVERFYDRWGERVAVLGGVDVHLLAVGDEPAVRARTLQVLEHTAARGGYACGSGNSIPDYVSPENYLTMVEAVVAFNGRV